MNSLIRKETDRKKLKAGSAGEGKEKSQVRADEIARKEIPIVTIAEDLPFKGPQEILYLKRRAPKTPQSQGQSICSSEIGPINHDAPTLRQVREDSHACVIRCCSNLFYIYQDDLCIVGVGPISLVDIVLRDVPYFFDADYIHKLGCS